MESDCIDEYQVGTYNGSAFGICTSTTSFFDEFSTHVQQILTIVSQVKQLVLTMMVTMAMV